MWAILPEALATLSRLSFDGERSAALFSQPDPIRVGSTSIIPIRGPIVNRSSFLSQLFGAPSTEDITQQLRAAVDDDQTRAIVLDIDSPGGTVAGTAELAEEVRALRERKTIVAQVNPLAASAAFWIAAQASKIVVTSTSDVGSIGILAQHIDLSGALDREGVNVTLISAGKFKTEANPFQPLTQEAKESIQQRVDGAMEKFVAAVAAGRGVSTRKVLRDFGEGRLVTAEDAVRVGMADRVGTLDTTIARAGGRGLRASEVETVRDFEKFLRDEGFSSNAAKSITAGGFRAATSDLRDGAEADDAEAFNATAALFANP